MYRTARASAHDLSFVTKDLHLSLADILNFKTLYNREKQRYDEFKAQVFDDDSEPLRLCTDHICKRDVNKGISYLNSVQLFGSGDQLRGLQGCPRSFFEIPGMEDLDITSIQQAVDQGIRYDYQELTPQALAWLTGNVPETEEVVHMIEEASPVPEFVQQPQRSEEQDQEAVGLLEPQGKAVFNDENHQAQDTSPNTPTRSDPFENDMEDILEIIHLQPSKELRANEADLSSCQDKAPPPPAPAGKQGLWSVNDEVLPQVFPEALANKPGWWSREDEALPATLVKEAGSTSWLDKALSGESPEEVANEPEADSSSWESEDVLRMNPAALASETNMWSFLDKVDLDTSPLALANDADLWSWQEKTLLQTIPAAFGTELGLWTVDDIPNRVTDLREPGSKSADAAPQEGSYGSNINPEHETSQTSHIPGADGEASRDIVVPSETFVVVPHDLVVIPYNPAEAIGQAKVHQDAVEALDDEQATYFFLMDEAIKMVDERGLKQQAFDTLSDRNDQDVSEPDASQSSDDGQAVRFDPQEVMKKMDELKSLFDASDTSFDKAFGSPVPSDRLQVDLVALNRPESPEENFDFRDFIRFSSSPPPADHDELERQLALPLFPHLLYTGRPSMFVMLEDVQKGQYWQCPESLTMSLRHDKDPVHVSFTGSWRNPISLRNFEPQEMDKSRDASNGSANEPYERYGGWWEPVPIDDTEAILGDNVDSYGSLLRESSPVVAFEWDITPAERFDASRGSGSKRYAPIVLNGLSVPFVFPSGYGEYSAWPFEKTHNETTVIQIPELFPQRPSSPRQPSLEEQRRILRHQSLARTLFPEDDDEQEQAALNRVTGGTFPEGILLGAASYVTGGFSTAAGEKTVRFALGTPSAAAVSHGLTVDDCGERAASSRLPESLPESLPSHDKQVLGDRFAGPHSAAEAGTQNMATELVKDTIIAQPEQSLQQGDASGRRGRARKVASEEPEVDENRVFMESDDEFHGISVPVAEDDDDEYRPGESDTPRRAQREPKTTRPHKKRRHFQPGTRDPWLGGREDGASASAGPSDVASRQDRGVPSSGCQTDQQRPHQQEPHPQKPPPSRYTTPGMQRSESRIFGPVPTPPSESGSNHAYYVVAGQVLKVAEPGRRTKRFHLRKNTIEKIARGDVPKHLALPRVERDMAAQAIIAAASDSLETLPPLPDWFPSQVAKSSSTRRPRKKKPSPLRDIPSFDPDAESLTPAMWTASEDSGRKPGAACGSFGVDLQPYVNAAAPLLTQAATDRKSVQANSSTTDSALLQVSGDSIVPKLGSVPPSENRSIMEQVSSPGPKKDGDLGRPSNTQPAGAGTMQAPTRAQDTSRSQLLDGHAKKPQKSSEPKGAKRKNPVDEATGKRARGRPKKAARTMDLDTAPLPRPSTPQLMLHDAPSLISQSQMLGHRAVSDGSRAMTTSFSRLPDEGRQTFLDAFCSGAPIPDPGEINGPRIQQQSISDTMLGVPESSGTNATATSNTTQSRLVPAESLALMSQADASYPSPSISTGAGGRCRGRDGRGHGRGRGDQGDQGGDRGNRGIRKRASPEPLSRKFDYSRVSFSPIKLNPGLLRSTPLFPWMHFFDDDEIGEEMDEVEAMNDQAPRQPATLMEENRPASH